MIPWDLKTHITIGRSLVQDRISINELRFDFMNSHGYCGQASRKFEQAVKSLEETMKHLGVVLHQEHPDAPPSIYQPTFGRRWIRRGKPDWTPARFNAAIAILETSLAQLKDIIRNNSWTLPSREGRPYREAHWTLQRAAEQVGELITVLSDSIPAP